MYVLEMFAPEFFMPNYENTIMQIMWIHSMSDAFNTFFLTRTNVIMCHHGGKMHFQVIPRNTQHGDMKQQLC